MTSRLLISVLFASALTLGAVFAQAAPAELVDAYAAGVAGKVCEPKLDSGKSSQLGDAVQRAEQKSGLGQDELDALWSQTQAAAKADNAGFCADAVPKIDSVIKAAQ